MPFSKGLLVGTLVALLLLTACSTSAPKKATPTPADAQAAETVPSTGILPPGPPTPNPYLQTKVEASPQAQQNFNAAVQAMDAKHWPQAETLLHKVVAENPQLSGAWLNLGFVYRAQDQNDKAEAAFKQAISANHANLDAYNALAILQREAGDFAGAEQNYLKALSLWPWHADSHKNLAILYDLYMGKSQEALPHYEAYQTLVGDKDKNIKSWIADLQHRLGIKPPAKAAPAAAPATEESQSE